MKLKQWLNLIFRKKLVLDWVTIKAKSRKGLRLFNKFRKNFNFSLFFSEMYIDMIVDGHCEFNINEVINNDRYKLDK